MCYHSPCQAAASKDVIEDVFERARKEYDSEKDRLNFALEELQSGSFSGMLPVCVTRRVIEEFGTEENIKAMHEMMNV